MWAIYWITRLDSIQVLLCVLAGLSCCILIGFSMDAIDEWHNMDNADRKQFKKRVIIFTSISLLALSLCILTPSTRTALLMYTGEYIENNKQIQEMPDKVVRCFDKLMDEYLDKESEE